MSQAKKNATAKWRSSRLILAALWSITFILFGIAIYHGGGEPLGLKALRKTTEARPPDPVVEFYNSSRTINQLPAQHVHMPPNYGTWIWWKLTLLSAVVSSLFALMALYYGAKAAQAWIQKWLEQRPARIRLQSSQQTQPVTTPTTASQPTVTQTIGGTLWSRTKRRVIEHLPGELFGETLYSIAEKILRSWFRHS